MRAERKGAGLDTRKALRQLRSPKESAPPVVDCIFQAQLLCCWLCCWAQVSGTVVRFVTENGKAVTPGQPLVIIKP